MTVGAAINFGLLFEEFALIVALTVGLIAIKAAVLLGLTTVFGIRGADRWLFSLGLAQAAQPDDIDEHAPIIIAGVGGFGGVVNRILLSAVYKTVVLDHQSEQLERVRPFGIKVFFGDASRPDLLHAAGIAHARMLVIAIGNRE
jgi:CPA2 family monovalent cation:H+ antiporter-2